MIKPIDTIYNGYKFRSRLEARWAVFFDTLKIRYEYECEGYEMESERYLPDFFLPDHNCWVEVKPESFTDFYNSKHQQFSESISDSFIVIAGPPRRGEYKIRILTSKHESAKVIDNILSDDLVFALARRATKPELCLVNEWFATNLISKTTDDGERWPMEDWVNPGYDAASQARFEF